MGVRAAALILGVALPLALGGCGAGQASTPRDPVALRDSAAAELERGRTIRALRLLRVAVAAAPEDSLSYLYLADVYRRGGWPEEGLETFRALAHGSERRPELGYLAAYFAASVGRAEESLAWVARARERRGPTYREALSLTDVLRPLGLDTVALGLLDEALAEEPAHPGAQARRLHVLVALGDTAGAAAEAERLIREFPDAVPALAVASHLHLLRGDLAAAQRYGQAWALAAPGAPEPLWNLARIALRRGEWSQAASLVNRIAVLNR